jgi:Lipocalin-like domain
MSERRVWRSFVRGRPLMGEHAGQQSGRELRQTERVTEGVLLAADLTAAGDPMRLPSNHVSSLHPRSPCTRAKVVSCACVSAIASVGAFAQECTGAQLGTWRLLSYTSKDLDTGETKSPYGLYPSGFLSYTADCRMYEVIVREHRTPPAAIVPTDAEKSSLFDGFFSYSATYAIDRGKLSQHIDTSWNEAWTGTTQTLQLRIDGNTLYTQSPPAKNPRDGRTTSESLIWVRMQ